MAGSFVDWKLSSSESEDESTTRGILLTIKNTKSERTALRDSDFSETYIPLSERLKAKEIDSAKHSDEDLPEFTFIKPPQNSNKENCSNVEDDSSIGTSAVVPRGTSGTKKGKEASKPRRRSVRLIEMDNSREELPQEPKLPKPTAECKKKEAEKRKALNSHLRAFKPEQCMNHMECRISDALVAMVTDIDLLVELQRDFAPRCIAEKSSIPSVRWRRKAGLVEDPCVSEFNTEPEMLIVLSANDLTRMISNHSHEKSDGDGLGAWMKMHQTDNHASHIHLVCHGLDRYRSARSKSRDNSSRAVKQQAIEEAFVNLQIECRTSITYTEKPEEIVNTIKQLTKSIAEAPYKRMKRQDVQFINEIPSVKVNPRTGDGLKKVWGQMIQQFHNVTPVMASAITDRYPTLPSLLQAYEDCGSDVTRAEGLLADIPVRRGVGTLQTNRRIGPELSHKLYKLLTSTNPDDRLY